MPENAITDAADHTVHDVAPKVDKHDVAAATPASAHTLTDVVRGLEKLTDTVGGLVDKLTPAVVDHAADATVGTVKQDDAPGSLPWTHRHIL